MTDILTIGLNAVSLTFALGLASYAHFLSRTFKSAILETPFKIFIVSAVIFVGAAVYALLGDFGVVSSESAAIMQSAFESLFLLTLFWGFYRLAAVWRTSSASKKEQSPMMEKLAN